MNAEENEDLTEMLDSDADYDRDYWIGYTDVEVEDSWLWADGSTSQYNNWRADWEDNEDEPSGGTDENCAKVYGYDNSNYVGGVWSDSSCTSKKRFICRTNG